MWGFVRNFLILVGVLTAFTIGEMILDAHDEAARTPSQAAVISH